MNSYLLGLATIPAAALATLGCHHAWRLLHASDIIYRLVIIIAGVKPQRQHSRSLMGTLVACAHRIWVLPLPGHVALMLVVEDGSRRRGGNRISDEDFGHAASVLTEALVAARKEN